MEKFKNIAIVLILVIVAIALYQTFAANSNLQNAIIKLDNTKKKLDSASSEIRYSKERVDSLQQNFARFSAYIKDVQGRLERMDLEKRVNEQAFLAKRDSIRTRLKELSKTVELTGQDLPEVPIIDSKHPQ
jgi:HAMP domain-containing protein